MSAPKKLEILDHQTGEPLAPAYNPSDFIVAPADSKGVSYRLTFRVPPDMEKAIDEILASKKFPFSTRGDVLRYTTHQGLKELAKMEPVTSVTKRVDILTSILNEEAAHTEFLAIFNHLQNAVEKYLAESAGDQATRVVGLAKHQFEGMPEGHWRERYLSEIDKRFGHLLKGKVGVALYSPK